MATTELLDFSSIDGTTDEGTTDQTADSDVVDAGADTGDDGGSAADDGSAADGSVAEGADKGQGEKLDGRRGSKDFRDSLKAAVDALPDHAARLKEMGGAYFREQAYKQHFATPQEAASAKQLIESVGGVEGIAKYQERDQMFAAQDAMLEEGNPEVLDDFFEDFPDGAVALAPAYLQKLAAKYPQALSAAVTPYAISLLQGIGFDSFLRTMHAESDPAKFKGLVEQLYNWFAGEHKKAGQARQGIETKNPGNERVKQQRTKLDQEREQFFNEGVTAKVRTSTASEMQKVVDGMAKRYGWNDKQKTHYQKTLGQRVVDALNADETYKSQLKIKQSSKARTHDTVANHISSNFNTKLNDMAYDLAVEIYGAPKGGKTASGKQGTGVVKAGSPKTAPGGGPILISAQPSRDQVNFDKRGAEELWIQNQAWLKNGRFVTWKD